MLVHPPPTNHKHLKSKNPRKPVSANNFELLFELVAKIKQGIAPEYTLWMVIVQNVVYMYCVYINYVCNILHHVFFLKSQLKAKTEEV